MKYRASVWSTVVAHVFVQNLMIALPSKPKLLRGEDIEMNRIAITASTLIFLALSLYAQSGKVPSPPPPARAGAPAPQTKRDDLITVDSDLVSLDARVVSLQTGRFVGGLKKEDFEIYEDGKRQEITHFSEDTPPLSVVFLIDMHGAATEGVFTRISRNLEQVLQHLRPDDQAAVMLVDSDRALRQRYDIWLLHAFTKDKKLLGDQSTVSALLGKCEKPPLLNNLPTKHQAIYEAELLLEQTPPATNRRAILTLTDDMPWWTRRYEDSGLFAGAGKKTIAKKDLTRRMFTAGTMFCALVTPDPVWTPRLLSVTKQLEAHPVAKIISLAKGYNAFEYAEMGFYAEPTGGETILATEEKAVDQLTEMIEHLYIRYSFGYVPTNRKRDGKFRKVTVKVSTVAESREGAVKVATKEGYYYPPAGKSTTERKK